MKFLIIKPKYSKIDTKSDMAKFVDLRGVKVGVKWRIFTKFPRMGGIGGITQFKKTLFCLNLTKLTLI